MGGKKKQTIGYHYKWAQHHAWGRNADACLELRGGDKAFFQGRVTTNSTVAINKADLWGGEKGQGGIVGNMVFYFGGPTQAPDSYLASTFGPKQSGNRGVVSTVFTGGRWGAFIANPPPVSGKWERIYAGGMGWYPEKARIPMATGTPVVVSEETSLHGVINAGITSAVGVTLGGFSPNDLVLVDFPSGLTYDAWTYLSSGTAWYTSLWITDAEGNETSRESAAASSASAARAAAQLLDPIRLTGSTAYTFWLFDSYPPDNLGGLSFRVQKVTAAGAMNPAHMIYEALTHPEMKGDPVGLVSDASFRAAADQLFAEGFGLCTEYDSDKETPEQFIQRICNVIGANCSQSRIDGLHYLDLIRDDYDPETLPVITESDMLSFKQTPIVTTEAVNCVRVAWFDPERKEDRTTSPVYSMGRIQDSGETIPQTNTYREVPTESLAQRLAQRDVNIASAPVSKFEITTRRQYRALRPGQPFRLQRPSDGIADVVCRLGSISQGTHLSGAQRLVAVQDIFGLPDSAFVQPSPGEWTPPSTVPTAVTDQRALEAPYVELAATLSAADLAAVPADAGYLLSAGVKPAVGVNYELWTAAAAEDYADHGAADWCPSATINETAAYLDTAFTLANASLLDRVTVGSWALWENEIVRVDALDATALTLTLGRGCADTVPVTHASGSRIWFLGDWGGTDQREYVGGDVVRAKLATRTTTSELDLADATELSVTMSDRQARPYPPADLKFNGVRYPSTIAAGLLTVSWVHRDRLLQLDQLVDAEAAGIGPEAGTTYRVRFYGDGGSLITEVAGITGTSYTWTEELSADPYYSNVKSLLHMEGINNSTTITDQTGKTWTCFGNAKISTAQAKFGGASAAFDGSGDYMTTPNSADFNFGTGDFTVEGFVRFNVVSAQQALASTYENTGAGWTLQLSATNKMTFNCSGDGADITGTTTIAANAWYHVAIARQGTSLRLFVNGALEATVTDSQNISSAVALYLGRVGVAGTAQLNGYLDEIRITKGVARYTAAFTPPAAPFPDSAGAYNSTVRVRLQAERDGLASWQEHDVTVTR